jgi:hypothetical protein
MKKIYIPYDKAVMVIATKSKRLETRASIVDIGRTYGVWWGTMANKHQEFTGGVQLQRRDYRMSSQDRGA